MKLLMLLFVATGSTCGMAFVDGFEKQENLWTLVGFLGVAALVWGIMIVISRKSNSDPRFSYFVPPATVLITAICTCVYLKYFAP
ncbi:MAG: hypothetical protein AAGH88_11270 [Planctomycetota bacterium]